MYVYIWNLCVDPNNVLWSKIVVESLLCNFKWTSNHPFARSAKNILGWFWGLGN